MYKARFSASSPVLFVFCFVLGIGLFLLFPGFCFVFDKREVSVYTTVYLVVLICVSLMVSDAEPLSMCLDMASLEKCPGKNYRVPYRNCSEGQSLPHRSCVEPSPLPAPF